MNETTTFRFIDNATELSSFCDELRGSNWVALDTEFLREKTYYPKFCLVQIATAERVACIDPLAIENLEPLLEIIYDQSIEKVLHACRQDLEIFFNLTGRVPTPIFDTQVAAPLLGFSDQISYGNLVSAMLGIDLPKHLSRTDWSRRPLSDEQLKYAVDDVIHLGSAYSVMKRRLRELGRLDWLIDDLAELTNPELYRNDASAAWMRIRGAALLQPRQRSALQALAGWREIQARNADVPRGWIVKDDLLLDIARTQPRSDNELFRIRGTDDKTLRRHADTMVALIQDAKRRPPPPPLDNRTQPSAKTAEQEALIGMMMAIVRTRAAETSIDATVIASRKSLEQLLEPVPGGKLLRGWRRHLVGDELRALLQGDIEISVVDQHLHLHPHE